MKGRKATDPKADCTPCTNTISPDQTHIAFLSAVATKEQREAYPLPLSGGAALLEQQRTSFTPQPPLEGKKTM